MPAGKLIAQVQTDSEIKAVTWLGNRNRIAFGGADGLLRIWDLDAENHALAAVKEIKAHEGPVTALDTVPSVDGQILSAGEDGSVRLWNVETARMIREMKHGAPVAAVAARPDGKRFASAGADKIARLLDANDGKEVARLKGDRYAQESAAERERALVFAKAEVDFHRAALKSAQTNQTAQTERVKKATDTNEAAEKALAEKQSKQTEVVEAKAAAEKALEEAKAAARKATEDFEAADKTAKRAESEGRAARETPGRNQEATEKAVADADTRSKAAAEARKAAEKVSAETKEKEKQATEKLKSSARAVEEMEKDLKKAEQTKSNTETELQLAGKAADEAAEAVADCQESVQQSEASEKQSGTELESAKKTATDSEQPIRAIAFSPDNLTLATASDDGWVHLWSADDGAAFETLKHQKGPALSVAFAGDGNLVVGTADRSVVVWNLKTEWQLEGVIGTGDAGSPLVDRVNAVKFSPDGKYLATGGGEPTRGGEIKLWQVDTCKLAQTCIQVIA